ncbi:MAG: LysR substrate-binding domain-containing protein [Acidimicrobiales bacterium]
MTLTQLRNLLAVADTGSVRAASERLMVSQPSISGAIASLEREIGVDLVEPDGRGLRFTPAGRAFVSSVRSGLAMVDRGVREARCIEDPGRGSVRIAAVTTAAERMLLPLLAEFRRRCPQADVVVRVGNRDRIWEQLRDREADLAVAGRPPPAVRARTLGRSDNRLVVVGPPPGDHGTGPARLDLTALGATPWLLREEGSGTREATEDLLRQLGVDPPRMILGSNGAVEQAVLTGFGVALISLDAVAGAVAAGTLAIYQCAGTPLVRPWHLVTGAGMALTATALLAARSMLTSPNGFVATADGRRVLAGQSPRRAERAP